MTSSAADSQRRRVRMHARVLVGALNALFVVAVGAVGLAVTATVAFGQLRDNGERHVADLAAAAAYRVDQYVRLHEGPAAAASEVVRSQAAFPFPSEHPTRSLPIAQLEGMGMSSGGLGLESFTKLWWGLAAGTDFVPMGLIVWLADGTRVGCLVAAPFAPLLMVERMFQNDTTNASPFAAPLLQRETEVFDPRTKAFVPRGQIPALDRYLAARDAAFPIIDARIPQVFPLVAPHANNTPGAAPVWSTLKFFDHGGRHFIYLYASTALFNGTGTLIGYTLCFAELNGIKAGLEAVKTTAGSQLFLVDAHGFILGATGSLPWYNTTALDPQIESGAKPVPEGCASTHSTRATVPSDNEALVCIDHARDSPYAVLRAMAGRGLLVPAPGIAVVSAGGRRYYARVARLEHSRLQAYAVVAVPEEDVLGDLQRAVLVAALSTAGVVVLAAGLSFCVAWAMLRPLVGIAERMGRAARLERVDGTGDSGGEGNGERESAFVEISDLQRAFGELRDELGRIRAFVPQALLYRTDTAEDDEFDGLGEHTPRSAQHGGTQTPGKVTPRRLHHSLSLQDISEASSPNATTPSRRSTVHALPQSRPNDFRSRLTAGVAVQNVSVLFLNVVGSHGGTEEGLAERAAATAAAVLGVVDQEKGVVDYFHGDRFMATFNASRPSATHGTRAAVAACRVAEAAARLGAGGLGGGRVTAGVASGAARVGNVGTAEMKRFTVFGAVVPQAACLERLCKLQDGGGARCLVAQPLFEDLRTAVELRTVDFVRLPGAKAACLVAAVEAEHAQAADDEWMYQLRGCGAADEGGAVPPVARANAAWRRAVAGDGAGAAAELAALDAAAVTGEGHVAPGMARLRAAVDEAVRTKAVTPAALGAFYDTAVTS